MARPPGGRPPVAAPAPPSGLIPARQVDAVHPRPACREHCAQPGKEETVRALQEQEAGHRLAVGRFQYAA
ncbi:hypothetical protein QR510_29970 [Escherichia coli]|uniref:hypothetical protein n=1 Tax=Escherichia coli TaxID=562 RepID=UPI00273A0162|nr:hypothetical protein [Escherichia coli]MDP4360860.1 hypothetical protein [Escherichia coli]